MRFATYYGLIAFVFLPLGEIHAQEDVTENAALVIDSLYREDQFYLGLSFNLLGNRPSGIDQNGLSGGVQAGFIRDMPFNKRRNKAIGVGLGISVDTYNTNLFVGEANDGETTQFEVLPSGFGFDINRLTYYSVEVPIQYRWRTSTITDYNFWRIYTGIRMGYIYYYKTTFTQQDPANEIIQTTIPELNKFQYGLTISAGYGAFNFQLYYGLNTLFDGDALLKTETVDLRSTRLGIQFFFL